MTNTEPADYATLLIQIHFGLYDSAHQLGSHEWRVAECLVGLGYLAGFSESEQALRTTTMGDAAVTRIITAGAHVL